MTFPIKPTVSAASLLLYTTLPLLAQPAASVPGAKLEFEVASVKPAAPMTGGFMRMGMRVDQGRMDYENVSLKDCIRTAYRLKDFQVSGPDWLGNTRFDISAKLPEGTTKDQVPEMLQSLLADRFKLTVHHDSKLHDSYALVVGKGGPKLTPSEPDDPSSPQSKASTALGAPGGGKPDGASRMTFTMNGGGGGGGGGMAGGGGMGTGRMAMSPGNVMKMQMKGQTMSGFADMLARYLASPVVDLTEIEGKYDFTLEMSMEDMTRGSGLIISKPGGAGDAGGAPADDASEPGGAILRSVQNYGLKLDKKKTPMDLVVVDHIEKSPTEN
ncbi:MAG TPA: TIGR03435 family protein [Bryobacteraceae bacterium]|nr:TIGR03435 family protein [Bryobacteraceae bacterium]